VTELPTPTLLALTVCLLIERSVTGTSLAAKASLGPFREDWAGDPPGGRRSLELVKPAIYVAMLGSIASPEP